MPNEEIDEFLNTIITFVDTCIMDRVCRGFPPTLFLMHKDQKLGVLVLPDLPVVDASREAVAAAAAESVEEMGLNTRLVAVAGLFTDAIGKYIILIAVLSVEGDMRFAVLTMSADDGVLAIKEKFLAPPDAESKTGATETLIGFMRTFHAAME